MNKIFLEFENENTQRTYPFASGCHTVDTDGIPIGTGILIDAALYPVNPKGPLFLSSIATDGTVSISDSTGVIMTSRHEVGTDALEFYDLSGFRRHVGTLLAASPEALDTLVGISKERTFRASATEFSSACVFPIENDGVLSVDVASVGIRDGQVGFANASDDEVRVSTDYDGRALAFDILPRPTAEIPDSIRHIYCIVDGKTPFRIVKLPSGLPGIPGNTIAVYLDNLDRGAICGNAHREDALVMADTCDCSSDSGDAPVDIPETYQAEAVDIPLGADSAFYLAVPNFVGYDNPLSLTLDDGVRVQKTDLDVETDPTGRKSASGAGKDDFTSKGVKLQVPGLAAS